MGFRGAHQVPQITGAGHMHISLHVAEGIHFNEEKVRNLLIRFSETYVQQRCLKNTPLGQDLCFRKEL